MTDLTSISMIAALLAGVISFLSPCVLPLVPGYVSYIAGRSTSHGADASQAQTLWLSFCFVLGFSTIFMGLGASASALGQMLLAWRYELNLIGGGIIILFGLFMFGAAKISALDRDLRFQLDIPGGKPTEAYVLGLAFGFGWTPCIGPILGAILTATAASATVGQGMALLGIYSAGLGVPFLLVALFTDRLTGKLRAARRLGHRLHQGAGALLVLMGFIMMTGHFTTMSLWLLDAFPALGQIG
ncbi:MAG: cytochrome c biogenesis CcdA family protein [Rhodobacterales bacterium]